MNTDVKKTEPIIGELIKDLPTSNQHSISISVFNVLMVNMTSQQLTNQKSHDCWRCLPDDEELITDEWLRWVGFEYIHQDWYLTNFSHGAQIDCKFNHMWMETPHNRVDVKKRWEVRALLSVHRERLLETGYERLFMEYSE